MKADAEKAKSWQQHIEAIKSSGLTRRVYCEQNGLNSSTLDYWCRKLNPHPQKKKQRKETEWIPLQIGEEGSTSEIDLRIGRITIAVKSGYNPTLLKELLRTLGALC
jgi:hypothetical protein